MIKDYTEKEIDAILKLHREDSAASDYILLQVLERIRETQYKERYERAKR